MEPLLDQVAKTQKPLLVTKWGKPAGVIITVEEYDRLMAEKEKLESTIGKLNQKIQSKSRQRQIKKSTS